MRLLRCVDDEGRGDGLQDLRDLGRKDAADVFAGEALFEPSLGDRRGDALRGVDAEVGADQQVLELLECRAVELALGDEAGDAVGQTRGRLGETGFQPLEPARAWRRLR